MMKKITIAGAMLVCLAGSAFAADTLYRPDTLIVPMDTTYQDDGMFLAYGLVYDLLENGIPVDWVIAENKGYGDVDLHATGVDVATSAPVSDHGYRGGPFVIDSAYYATALLRVVAWQADHPEVVVHRVTQPFTANRARQLLRAPTIAVFVDGKEDVAFGYLNAAAVPMGNGDPWPDKKNREGLYPCPGDDCCPDCINEADAAGPTTTSHTDGALFDAKGAPRYCQFLSMHYKHPAPAPEVVAEVREFLEYPVHFLAECQAVNAFENDPNGRFLTGNGLVAGSDPTAVDYQQNDSPFAQADGAYASPGGSEPSFSLDTGSYYYNANIVMVTNQGTPVGTEDVWMTGHMDDDPAKGKVSYLGGHKFSTTLPLSANPESQGVRYFLNSLFEAPCSADEGTPDVSVWPLSPTAGTNSSSYTLSFCYENSGPGLAFDATFTVTLPAGATFDSASHGGVLSGSDVVWDVGSIPVDGTHCPTVTVEFGSEGSYDFDSSMTYMVGMTEETVSSSQTTFVTFGSVNLLRYGGITSAAPTTPAGGAIFGAGDPALDTTRDLEKVAFTSGSSFDHDVSDLLAGAPPLVFYELSGTSTTTLRVNNAGGLLVITY